MNVFNTDGWSKPIYTDDWGNVMSSEEVEKMKRKKEIQQMFEAEMEKAQMAEQEDGEIENPTHRVIVEWECEKCGAFGTGLTCGCPYCGKHVKRTVQEMDVDIHKEDDKEQDND